MTIEQPDSWYQDAIWIVLAQHPALWANRNSPRIHTAFAQLWKRSDLWMNVDVCGVNPPERPGYRFRGAPLYWDMTLTPPVRFGTQAILYLTDTAANQGAFSCVPGFHRRLETWLKELPEGADPRAHASRRGGRAAAETTLDQVAPQHYAASRNFLAGAATRLSVAIDNALQ